MQYLPTRRVVTAVLAAAGMAGSYTLAMGQTQGPPPDNAQIVPSPRSSPPDTKPKSRPAIPQDMVQTPVQQPAPQTPPK
jgi:hypothetical protein